jgi:hypothetical protein
MLAVLTASVILSKQPFWISLPFSYLWIAYNSWSQRSASARFVMHSAPARKLALLVTLVVLLVSPLKLVHPLSIPDYRQQFVQMQQSRAAEGFKPSNPTYPGFRLAARDVSFAAIWLNPNWYLDSAASFYGKFGYLTVALPPLHYQWIGGLALFFVALSYWFAYTRRSLLSNFTKLALVASPLFLAISVLASLYSSWTYDYQPQGRYLFPALIPLALMLTVTLLYEPRWSKALRFGVWVSACILCLFTLYHYVLINPLLVP